MVQVATHSFISKRKIGTRGKNAQILPFSYQVGVKVLTLEYSPTQSPDTGECDVNFMNMYLL